MTADTLKSRPEALTLRLDRPSMLTAKRLMSAAAAATLRNDPRSVQLATAALAALKAATEGASNTTGKEEEQTT